MRVGLITLLLLGLVANIALAEDSCLDPATLAKLDSEWEKALLNKDVEWLELHLADEFVWVHNHATLTDSRATLLARAGTARQNASLTRSRVQSEVKVRVVGSTGVVTGYTVVDRRPGATRYHFMRTYVAVSGRCFLLGNHTMVVPESKTL